MSFYSCGAEDLKTSVVRRNSKHDIEVFPIEVTDPAGQNNGKGIGESFATVCLRSAAGGSYRCCAGCSRMLQGGTDISVSGGGEKKIRLRDFNPVECGPNFPSAAVEGVLDRKQGFCQSRFVQSGFCVRRAAGKRKKGGGIENSVAFSKC
jgi:hypothetical protein